MSTPIRITPSSTLLALTLLAGCGGKETSPTPPPPPPPPVIGAPASMTIQAGDAQQGSPGAAVPVAPAVLVKDAAGHAVPGATVTFAVETGGGSVTNRQAATGSDGTATSGSWILGAAEGANALTATVGSLPAVHFTATGVFALTPVGTGTIGSAGGSVAVNLPGSPVNGMRLDVPSGALTAPASFTFALSSSSTIPVNPKYQIAGPLVTIGSDGPAFTKKEFSLTMPLTVPAGTFPMVLLLDSHGGIQGFMKVRSYDATSVTVAGQVLDQGYLNQPSASGAAPSAASVPAFPHAVMAAPALANLSLITNPPSPLLVNTGFRPSRDGWEFQDLKTAYFPDISAGQVISAFDLWFTSRGATTLFGHYQRAPGVQESNPSGIMLSAGLSAIADDAVITAYNYDVTDFNQNPHDYYLRLALSHMAFMTWRNVPSIMTLATPAGKRRMVLAYGYELTATRKVIYIYDPMFPGDDSRFLDFSNGDMANYVTGSDVWTWASTPSQPISWVDVTLGTMELQSSLTYPYEDLFPAIKTTAWDSIKVMPTRDGPDSIFAVDDTMRIFSNCTAACDLSRPIQWQHVFARNSQPAPWADVTQSPAQPFFVDFPIFSHPSGQSWFQDRLGIAFQTWINNGWTWGGWREFEVIKYSVKVLPVRGLPNVPITLTAVSVGGPPLPAGAGYAWHFNDGTPEVDTQVPTVTHTFTSQKLFNVVVDVYGGAPTSQGMPLIAEGKGVADLGGAKLIAPAGPFKIDIGYKFAFSIGTFAPGTGFIWELNNGRYEIPFGGKIKDDSTRTVTPTEIGSYTLRVSAVGPAGDLLAIDSTKFNVTSTFPWPTFEVTSLNMGALTGNIKAWDGVTFSGIPFATHVDTMFFGRVVRKEVRMYLMLVPADTVRAGFILPAVGLYYTTGSGPLPKGGYPYSATQWSTAGQRTSQVPCPLITDDPTLAALWQTPAPGTDGSIVSQWPLRGYGAIQSPGCGNVNVIPSVVNKFDLSWSGSLGNGDFTITYRIAGQGTGNSQRPDIFRWTLGGTFSVVRVR